MQEIDALLQSMLRSWKIRGICLVIVKEAYVVMFHNKHMNSFYNIFKKKLISQFHIQVLDNYTRMQNDLVINSTQMGFYSNTRSKTLIISPVKNLSLKFIK